MTTSKQEDRLKNPMRFSIDKNRTIDLGEKLRHPDFHEKRAANLPQDNNEELTRKVASIHESRPRFGDRADENHSVEVTETAPSRTEKETETEL